MNVEAPVCEKCKKVVSLFSQAKKRRISPSEALEEHLCDVEVIVDVCCGPAAATSRKCKETVMLLNCKFCQKKTCVQHRVSHACVNVTCRSVAGKAAEIRASAMMRVK